MIEKLLDSVRTSTNSQNDNDSSRDNAIAFGNVILENNAISFNNGGYGQRTNRTTLQISNISKTWVGKTAEISGVPKFPLWTVVVILISLVLIFVVGNLIISVMGIAAILFAGYVIYKYFNSIKPDVNIFSLHVRMNSGQIAAFSSLDVEGLLKFQEEITDRFIGRTPKSETLVVNIDGNAGNISFGDGGSNSIDRGDFWNDL